MKVSVKAIRQHGIRLTDMQIAALPATTGVLTLYGLGTTLQISLRDPARQIGDPLLPDLYDARLVSMQNVKMLFAGIQRTADSRAAQYLQEWSVTVIEL